MYELGTDGPRRILVGVDGSESSLKAGSYAVGLARRQSSEVVVLHVMTQFGLPAVLAATAGVALPHEGDAYADELERLVHSRAAEVGVPVQFLRRFGSPCEQLVAVAAELQVDAIVIGASHHGHHLAGSLAGRLIRHSRWPVTVVP